MRQGDTNQSKSETQSSDSKQRYHWSKPSDLPERVELIDRVTGQGAVVVLTIDGQFPWKRTTSTMIHGTPPAEGTAGSLAEAKAVAGLKIDM